MLTYVFHQLDVFPRAEGLTAEKMQALAREMNLSETTFVTPSSTATRRVRFFTPTAEIPLAGHPTIGTWWMLGQTGEIDLPEDDVLRVYKETGNGVLPVDITVKKGSPTRVVMTQSLPQFGESVPTNMPLGEALGGDHATVPTEPAPQVVSTALPQLIVPMRSLAALQSLPSGGQRATLAALLRELGTDCAMCYALETVSPDATVHCRMFAPGLGVPEDPATGSAAGALGSFLVWHGVVRPHDGIAMITVEQGIEIGRPSRIDVEIAVGNGGEITEVRVGGEAVTVIKGEVTI